MKRLLLALCAASCGGGAAIAPDGGAALADAAETPVGRRDAAEVPGGERIERTLSPEGGAIVSSDGRFVLRLPPGAIASSTRISVEVVPLGVAIGATPLRAYAVEPAGLLLAAPGLITIAVAEDAPPGSFQALRVARRDGEGSWTPLALTGADAARRLVAARADRLGVFGVISRRCDAAGACSAGERCALDPDAPASDLCALPCEGDRDCPDPLYCLRGACGLALCDEPARCTRPGHECALRAADAPGACAPTVTRTSTCGATSCTPRGCDCGLAGCPCRTWDAFEQFSRGRALAPRGFEQLEAWVWKYGRAEGTSRFIAFDDVTELEAGFPYWNALGTFQPRVGKNLTGVDLGGPYTWPATEYLRIEHSVSIGSSGAVLRFVAPRPGSYAVVGKVRGLTMPGPNGRVTATIELWLVRPAGAPVEILPAEPVPEHPRIKQFSGTIRGLAAGDAFDLVLVNDAATSPYNDETGLAVRLTYLRP